MDEAPVRLFVRGAEVYRDEPEWPLPARDVRAVLSAQGAVRQRDLAERRRTIARQPPDGRDATSYSYPDWEWRNGVAATGLDGRPDPVRRVLTFTSAPLDADLESPGRSC